MKFVFIHLLFVIVVFMMNSCIVFKPNNNLKKYTNKFVDTIKVGFWVENIDSGKILFSRYLNGKKQGAAKIIYRNGEYEILYFKDNLKDGLLKHYLNDGLLCFTIKYSKDKIIETKRLCGLKF